ncbi:lamin tail domain-containing protein 1 isoform X2 [Chelonoidis abingdonii]|uniref:lamin tail domain-containing protein 1 isoform X2 n=1 Tax=Chelonoidis abingdonii TaxID=106734 RepID=UPI0013F220A5|nr:lamin tail domain-containing protein 1 isoform X2 [Chelonoidis abingdonii]
MAAISGTYEKKAMPAPQEQLEVSRCGKMRTEISGHKNAQMETRSQSRQEELDTVLLKKDEDLKNLKLLVAQKETDLQELKTQRTLSSKQLDLAMKELEELNKNILMSQRKYEEEFSQRLKLQDQVLQLKHQLEHQKENSLQGSKEMRQRLAWSEVLILQPEGKLQELSNGDSDSMAKVQKIRETNEVEVKQIQEETATAYHQNFLELQMRLHTDPVMLGKMQEENQRVDMLTVEVMALQKKLLSEEANNSAFIEKLQSEHRGRQQHIGALEARLEELQDLFLAKMKALEAVEEKNISLQNEISLLKSTFGGEKGTEATHFNLAPNLSYSGHSPVTSTPIIDASPQPSENVLSPQSLQPASAATMINGITAAPKLAKSARADPTTQKRVLAQGSTNTESPKWSCSRSSSLSLDTNTLGQGQDYFSSLFVDSKKNAQHPRPLERQGRTLSAAEDYISSAARHSAIGNLKIAEVHSGGHFVKILNCSPDKEEGIGEYTLQQNVNGHPVTVFKFPPRIRMKANSTVTVWTADAKVPHKPPSDFLWKEQVRFQTGPECTTILCEPNGQAVVWYTPIHCNRKQGWKEQEDDEYLKSSKKSIIPSKMQREEWKKEPESVIIDTEQEGGVQGRTEERGPVFIKREKKIPATLFPTQNSWCRSPASPTHPHFSLLRPLTMGNDGSSLCRQSRCQSAIPDPAPGTLYAGTSRGRNTATRSFNGKSRRLTRSAGPNLGGVMYIGSSAPTGSALQKYFLNSPYIFSLPTPTSFTPTTFSNF